MSEQRFFAKSQKINNYWNYRQNEQNHTPHTIPAKSLIYTETQHPDSYARIQEMEKMPKQLHEEVPEADKQVKKGEYKLN